MADEHDRPLDRLQDAAQVLRVGGEAAQRVGRGDASCSRGAAAPDLVVPAGGVGEGAVDEDDRRLGLRGGRGSAHREQDGDEREQAEHHSASRAAVAISSAVRPAVRCRPSGCRSSTTVAPARSDMARCAGGGIIRSSVGTRYQVGLVRQAGSPDDAGERLEAPGDLRVGHERRVVGRQIGGEGRRGTSRGPGTGPRPGAAGSAAPARRAAGRRSAR